jgi:tRNA threonylcarbamoyl adenosine modification protein YeaZ
VLLIALDTCDSLGSVAVLRDGDALQTVSHQTSEDYSTWLLPAVGQVLQAARTALGDLEAYAVTAGPGSFTGVRAGLTTVKAWAEIYGRGIALVSRLEAIAAQASGDEPYVAAFSDARRDQLYAALYRRNGDGALDCIGDEMVIAPSGFTAWVWGQAGGDAVRWISTEPKCVTETDSWAARRTLGETVQNASSILAPVVGRLGYALAIKKRLTDALAADANYVRRTDAEVLGEVGPQQQAMRRTPAVTN